MTWGCKHHTVSPVSSTVWWRGQSLLCDVIMFWAVKNGEGLTNQSPETNNSVEKLKGTFLKRKRDQEVLKCHRRANLSETWISNIGQLRSSIMAVPSHNTHKTSTLNSQRHFTENHFFYQHKSRPFFYQLSPTTLSFKYHSEVKQHLSNISLRIPCK